MAVDHLSPAAVAELLRGENPPRIIDVREPWEHELVHIERSELIPLNTLPTRASALDPAATYAMLCHHGMRSEMAANWLAQHGFTQLINIDGGIDAWAVEVAPGMRRY
jgi:rhodanese-related sulfurtransferase